jgi:hypothetical protein
VTETTVPLPLTAAFDDASEQSVRAALAAVLDLHRPLPTSWGQSCTCWARGGSRNIWPCPELLAIVAALGPTP